MHGQGQYSGEHAEARGAGGRYTDGCEHSTPCEYCKQAPRILLWHHKCCRDSLLQPGVNVPREMPERPPNPFILFCRDIKDEVCRHPTIPPYRTVLVLVLSPSELALQCCEPSWTI
jgi:hypothetical protein